MRTYSTGFLRGRRKRWSCGACAETRPKVEGSAQAGAYMRKTVLGGEGEVICVEPDHVQVPQTR